MELPRYQTPGSAGFDFVCRETVTLAPGEAKLIPSNNVIEAPAGYFLAVLPRSGTFMKKGLLKPNSVGVIDRDFSGPDDEIGLLFYNPTSKPVTVEKGERIAQGIFIKINQVEWEETDEIRKNNRGGLGSTG